MNRNLQRVVNLDIEYFYEKNYKKVKEQDESVLVKISDYLHEQLLLEYNGTILNNIKCLADNFSQDSIDKLALQIEEQCYLPNQIIFNEESTEDFSMMYVIEGEIELTKIVQQGCKERAVIGNVGKEQVLGQQSFFTGAMRAATARAKTFTTILKIPRENFLNIIQEMDKDNQQYHLIKDSILTYKNYGTIQIKCSVCNKSSHYTSDCPLVHFDKEEYYGKIRFYEKVQQQRKSHQRIKKKSLNTLFNLENIEQRLKDFEMSQQNDQNEDDEQNNSKQTSDNDEFEATPKHHAHGSERQIQKKNQTFIELDTSFEKYGTTQVGGSDLNNQIMKINHSHIQKAAKSNFESESASNKQIPRDESHKNEILKEAVSFLDQNSQGLETDSCKIKQHQKEHNEMSSFNIENGMKTSKQKQKKQEPMISQELVHLFQSDKYKTKIDYEHDRSEINKQLNNPWLFEKQKDYTIYFPEGNSQLVLTRHNRISRKKQRQQLKKISTQK